MSAMRRGRLKTGSYKGVGKLIGHAAANMIGGAAFDQGSDRQPAVSQSLCCFSPSRDCQTLNSYKMKTEI